MSWRIAIMPKTEALLTPLRDELGLEVMVYGLVIQW
jgi:hypothetical protein